MNSHNYSRSYSFRFLSKVIIKGLILFFLCNLVFSITYPIDFLERFSAYNIIFPGRKRLPFGERPDLAYNMTIDNLPAMFSSHEINKSNKQDDEFQIFIIGDSSVWGYLLPPESTLSEQINLMNIKLPDGRLIQANNLGYPTLSVTKDFLILNQALNYQPNLVIWLVTLESLVWDKQSTSPLVQANSQLVNSLLKKYEINLDGINPPNSLPSYWEKTIIGQRRALADLFRLQLYGVLWAATGIDQAYPEAYELPKQDLEATESYYSFTTEIKPEDLAISILKAGITEAGSNKVLIVNEPIFVSAGKNSDIRYNFFYPRWAYDQYRILLATNQWLYLDAWDLVPPEEFTNSAIHLSSKGTNLLANEIVTKILNDINYFLDQ